MEFVRPQQGEAVRFGLRNLYILPTRFGWHWLGASLVLQLVGIQLQRNGSLLLSFLLLGLFLLTLHLTHLNLQGLELRCGNPQAGFAGAPLAYPLVLRCPGRCEGLRLQLGAPPPRSHPGKKQLRQQATGPALVLTPGEHRLTVPWTPQRRGLQRPGCLRLQTTAPLGLFVCWSRWEPAVPQLVWPARRAGGVQLLPRGAEPENRPGATSPATATAISTAIATSRHEGSEDWQDLRPHRVEDAPGRLAWKLLAAGRGHHAKHFAAPPQAELLLAPDPGVPFERALEHLSERIWRLHARGESYGLALPRVQLAAGRGTAHRDRCLAALATCP
jgi:uncharacterized protein (DUF58 family)